MKHRKLQPLRRLDVLLYRHGVRARTLRKVLTFAIIGSLTITCLGMALWMYSNWIFWCGIGAMLSAGHFFSLTKFVPKFIVGHYTLSAGIALFLQSQIRLIAVVVLGALCVALGHAPVGALLTGFGICMISIVWNVIVASR